MSLLVFALVVLLIAALVIAIFRYIPGLPAPFTWIIPVVVLIVALLVIANRAGVL
ncbi:MAG: hypothetical protein Q7T61_01010 [Caulobacter sp.]|nr:hypothetical protein [Caulobacter sp.]